MDSPWSKLVVFGIMAAGVIVLVKYFSARKPIPQPNPKTFYDTIAEDDKRLRADIKTTKPEKKQQEETELSPEDLQAEKLFEMALAQRKMARLPGISYKLMVDYCREIIERYPKSAYAPKARRMLGEVPEQYRQQYNITEQEINLETQ
jgi:hypothetical protein